MRGILQEVSGNVVKIDNKYYDATNVIHFLPSSVNISVEYSVDSNGALTYIRPISQSKRNERSFTPKKLSKTSDSTNRAGSFKQTRSSDPRGEKIAKQLLLKIADNKTNNFSYASIDEALNALDEVYQKLKKKYLDEIK